jgi:hypothetical protein
MKMAFKDYISLRFYGIVATLFVAFCSIDAINFPGRGQDLGTMLERSRSIQSIRDSILRKLGRASTNIRESMIMEPQNMASPATPLEPEFISETQEIIAFSEPIGEYTRVRKQLLSKFKNFDKRSDTVMVFRKS